MYQVKNSEIWIIQYANDYNITTIITSEDARF